jgi:DNA-binding protein Fis
VRQQADSGYQDIAEIHGNSEIPRKKSKKHPLTKLDKKTNRRISRERADLWSDVIENGNAVIRVFKIMTYPYRNRTRAAAELGISRKTIINKIKAYGLEL